jgi:hypothetical protein
MRWGARRSMIIAALGCGVLAAAVFASGAAAKKKHKRVLLGAVVRVSEVGEIDYTGDDAWQEALGCENDDGTVVYFPREDHHMMTLKWRTKYQPVTIGFGVATPFQTAMGTTSTRGSTYSLRGFSFTADTPQATPCQPQKVTEKCSGTFSSPGRNNAEMLVEGGDEIKPSSLETLIAKPARCLDSLNDTAGTIDDFTGYYQSGGSNLQSDSLVNRAGATVKMGVSIARLRRLVKSGSTMREYQGGNTGHGTAEPIPENCSSPDDAGGVADNCSQTYTVNVTLKAKLVRPIYGH